jgi:hypothetical protein
LPFAADPADYIIGFVLATGLIHLFGIGVGLGLGRPFGGRLARADRPRRSVLSCLSTLRRAQYDRLALLYTIASVRRGEWLIPAFHAAIDAEIRNGHDDPMNFDIGSFADSRRGHLMGFLYVDGHVRAYHGQRAISSNAYVARRHLAMPATTDYWVNDRSGDPLLVITGEVDAALTKALPRLLREVREVVGERRVTIVFDRGGWSPKLFAAMIKDGFDVLTYRKGRCRRINERRFVRRRAVLDGCPVDYLLHDEPVRFLKGKLRLRQVTRLCDGGHQTSVITSRWDLRDIEVAYRMFERWRQENFFKYMREEFLLDALVDYQIEPEDPTRTIPNPERQTLDNEIRTARAEVAKLERELGAAAAANAEHRRPTMRGFKIAHGKLGKQLRNVRAHLSRLLNQRRDAPKRVEVREVNDRALVKLATERKHLTDIIKMVAYQAESDLVALLRPHYARVDQEGRTLLHELFATAGDIHVSDSELTITLAPLSSPHRTHAAQALCEVLNKAATIFPGSRLRMRFNMRPPRRLGLAFPGSPVERSAASVCAPTP